MCTLRVLLRCAFLYCFSDVDFGSVTFMYSLGVKLLCTVWECNYDVQFRSVTMMYSLGLFL